MHIQDGVLNPGALVVSGAAAVGAVAYAGVALRRSRPRLGLALAGAGGVLIAHLLDVPLGAGLTGHAVGGTLLAVALGPWLAVVTMTGVLALEALAFGDGGAAALGVNVMVMAVVGVLVGWAVYQGVARLGKRWAVPGAGLAAFASVVASALVLVGFYGVGSPAEALPHYLAWAALEAAVTTAVLAVALGWAAHRPASRAVAVPRESTVIDQP
ncbi:energy-coupling factor ABC transporter permease [Demequina phytophila]|uniref:energy-coupling factor ABC transporter permease n=1 Tax=Demequina phytophila TaxID=1638981 RepID=UPI0007813A4D|nr:energy-coupling factor ABC transporter permease [Demequina phytophila]